jgi:hypothetical protein
MGNRLLQTAWVTGYSRVPDPPAKMIPLQWEVWLEVLGAMARIVCNRNSIYDRNPR